MKPEVNGATVATVTPARTLGFGEVHTVSASNAVRDRAGNGLAATDLRFTTLPRTRTLALGAHVIDSCIKRRWAPADSQPWNVLPTLVDHGFEWLRVARTR